MLSELYIENLAVIQKAEIPFAEGFNVFTGETGAGKSILINGINAVLGKRVSKDIVRSGCEKAEVTAMFRKLTQETVSKLNELGVDCENDELMITREIFADGGSTARINSRTAPVSVVKEIGETLIDIHGQHDNRILMYPEKHIDMIDRYAGLDNILEDYRTSFKELQNTARKIRQLTISEQERQEKVEFHKQFIEDIGSLELDNENEDTEIENEYVIASNSKALSELLIDSRIALMGDDDSSGISEKINDINNDLSDYADILPELSQIAGRLEAAVIEIDDIGEELSKLCDRIDIDEERMEFLSDRREKLNSAKKRYSCSLKELMSRYDLYTSEAEDAESCSKEIERLAERKNELLVEVTKKAENLSGLREASAEKLMENIASELKFLDMPNVKICFEYYKGKLTSNGMDTIEMMISVNPGEPPKPISKIASGGELSRIMLAIKNVIAEKEDIPTMIFDEIDTGISGRAAQKVGVKLRQVSRSRQIICVTHLSQIAIMADEHLLIEKTASSDNTFTSVTLIDGEQRVKEIARILGGEHITETTIKNAAEQLDSVESIYNEILGKS